MAKMKKTATGKNKLKNMSDTNLLLLITVIVFFLMYIGAIVFQGGGFLKPQTFFNILNANAALLIASLGMSIVMITGSIDTVSYTHLKRHIPMHHSAKTDGADISKYHIVFFFHIFCHFLIAIAKTCPNIVQCIGPDSIIQTIFPFMITGSDRMMFFIDQNRFNSCRTKLQSKNCFAAFDHFFDLFFIFHNVLLLICDMQNCSTSIHF